MTKNKTIVIIGGGAAGFFAAINCAMLNPLLKVIIIEKSANVLAKVKISGGGRCNVTNSCSVPKDLIKNYPRGEKILLKHFKEFNPQHLISWFEQRGIKLKTENDGRVFPVSNNSQTIIDCFIHEARKHKVIIQTSTVVKAIKQLPSGFEIQIDNCESVNCDKILIATGGNPNQASYNWIEKLGHKIEKPAPSLFTFNLKDKSLCKLMGVSIPEVCVKIPGTKYQYFGPLLITHWGISGPAVLKLSAFAARYLNESNYKYKVIINWLSNTEEDALRKCIHNYRNSLGSKLTLSSCPFELPKRIWEYILSKSELEPQTKWSELSGKGQNKLINNLICDTYEAEGKIAFKEEFVTCGGVSLESINHNTLESKNIKGLFFAGEVLDIDGITGGFNFQAAWTTGWIASKQLSI